MPAPAGARFFLAVVGGAGWLVGIAVASAVDAGPGFWLLMAAAALAGAAALWRVGRVGLLLAGAAALALGGARLAAAQPSIDAGALAFYNGQTGVEVRGQVIAEPERRDTSLRLRVAARAVVLDGRTRPVAGVVTVQTHRYPAVDYGATVSLRGDLEPLDALGSAGFAAYLERQGVASVMAYPDVTVLATDGGSPLRRALLAIRARGRITLAALLPEPQASLLTGILLGDDSGLPRTTADAFQATGMTHVIAISGFNIALIVALLDRLTAPLLPRRSGALVIILFLAFYTLLVGAAPSVVRAAIMGSAYLIGLRLLGRPTWALAGLFVAAFFMTLLNPNTLWDVGFQLSFAATLGLMLYATPWLRRLDRGTEALLGPEAARPIRRLLGEAVVVSLAAQVLVVPLLLYHFGRLSLASLPANLLVLPAQPAVMASGGAALFAGLLLPAAGRVVAVPAWLFLTYTLAVIDRLASAPWASVPLRLSGPGLVAAYAVIGALTLLATRDRDTDRTLAARWRLRPVPLVALGGAAVVVVLAVAWWAERPDGRLHVAFLDVGQGDAIFIQSPGGAQVLIDGGRYPSVLLERLGEQMPFWDHSLDLVIATHPDDDHVAGLPEVVARYDVAQVITNGATADDAPA
ncbi:MAG TPA: ComEC/Rec2 family competence protein, partial [Promineifilum sp.]|nr:ComEC/Rec2 family competence protein [Promineifilum sp.]